MMQTTCRADGNHWVIDGRKAFITGDPPYGFDALEAALSTAAALVAPGGRLVLEHDSRRASPERVEGLERVRLLEAGDSALSFYRHAAPGSPPDPS
jgi:16S rRNA G966 N2-methylase RsmD